MSDAIIQVENLSKLYHIGHLQKGKVSAGRALAQAVTTPFKRAWGLLSGHAAATADLDEELWALKDVNFEVKPGEVLGIIGRNGAGKSTLLKILSRIVEPTAGRITIKGRMGSLLEVGTGFHPDLTGRENVYLNGSMLGMRTGEIDRKFDEIVAFSEVEKFIDTPVKHYSSGMYTRLAFAVAAHLEPEILIVDEVLAVGDARFQRKCLGQMSSVAKQGRTILFVSHQMGAVRALCSRCLYFKSGEMVGDADSETAIGQYYADNYEASLDPSFAEAKRTGEGNIRITRIEISRGPNTPSGVVICGAPAEFSFSLTQVKSSLGVTFTVYDRFGQPVTMFNSRLQSLHDQTYGNREGRFVCRIEEMLLVPGQYRINVAVMDNDILEDHLDNATVFEVQAGAVRGRNVSFDQGYGSIVLPNQWKIPAA